MEKEPTIQINADTNRIEIDILRPELFRLFKPIEDDDEYDEKGEGRKDKLNIAKEGAEELKNSEKRFYRYTRHSKRVYTKTDR